MIANKTRFAFLLALLISSLLLAACGDGQPNRYEVKVWVVVGTIYQIRDDQLNVVKERFCWADDEACHANPWNFPVPQVTP